MRILYRPFVICCVLLLVRPFALQVASASWQSGLRDSYGGKVEHLVLSATGRVDGVVLDSHAVVHFANPATTQSAHRMLGMSIEVSGVTSARSPNAVVSQAVLHQHIPAIISTSSPVPTATARPAHSVGVLYAVDVDSKSSEVSRIILDSGTTVQLPRGSHVDPAELHMGEAIDAEGVVKDYPAGKFLRAVSLTLQNHDQLVSSCEGEPWRVLHGRVAQLVVDAYGDIDGLLLGDETHVHFRPISPTAAHGLATGSTVVVSGQGDTVFQAEAMLLSDSNAAVDLDGPIPTTIQLSLTDVAVDSAVREVWVSAAGEPEIVFLQDGSQARVPAALREDARTLRAGQHVVIRGQGGVYPLGTALRAESIETDERGS